ncbi:nuclear transport factor 2 family protein [Undibacterium sp. Ji83W]|uniref:nuclear transport factor 2 family protein n=1 Tax=Undibacterium sp. Ji83W TaxID=3413043 RepID=UPI003BF2E787
MKDEEKKITILAYLAAYNHFDIDGMIKLLHADIIFKNIAGGEINAQTNGMQEFRSLAEQSKGFFSSRQQQASNFQFQHDSASVDISYEGVAVDLSNGLKTGETLKLEGRSELTVKDDLLIAISDYS